jgi:hypothetical protein
MPKEPTQRTQPKKGEPIEIPVPKRDDVLRVFDRAAQPIDKPTKPRRRRRRTK